MQKKFTAVSIPTALYRKIEAKIEGSRDESVSSYVTRVLTDIISEDRKTEQSLSKDEEEKIKERLKALGYID